MKPNRVKSVAVVVVVSVTAVVFAVATAITAAGTIVANLYLAM
jgi:hypothetical protein